MAELVIRGELAQRLRDIAARENRSVNEVLRSMIDQYLQQKQSEALLDMDGMFDDDVTDLSSITKEDVQEAYRKKFDREDTE
jgi:hypothetical protein